MDAARCVNAEPDAFSNGAQIEFSVLHDQRSGTWNAERIVMLNATKRRRPRPFGDDSVDGGAGIDDDAVEAVPLEDEEEATLLMESLRLQDEEAERKEEALFDVDLVRCQQPEVEWLENHEQKYKATRSAMTYDLKIYVDVPFDGDEALRNTVCFCRCGFALFLFCCRM